MNYRKVIDPEDIQEYIGTAKVVAFDFETSPLIQWRADSWAALDAHKSEIVGVSLSVEPGTGIYVPLQHWDGGNADPVVVIPVLRDLVWENPDVVKVAHNIAFESMFLYMHGIILREPVYDTIAAAQMTLKTPWEFRGLGDSGLKRLVPELLGVELPTFEEVTGGRFFDELLSGDPETIRYACADSDYALQLYLDYHKRQFQDTIALCPQWTLVDFYVDHGISAPNMEFAPEWCRLLDDCFSGKINLIITQKVSNVTRKPENITLISRILAAQKKPVGIYFISENLFTLASYYQRDLLDTGFFPEGMEKIPEDDTDYLLSGGPDVESNDE